MKIRTKYRITLGTWIISGFLLQLGATDITPFFLIPLFVVSGMLGCYVLNLRCPTCGKRVLHNPIRIFNRKLYMWTSWIPHNCTKCGTDLDKISE